MTFLHFFYPHLTLPFPDNQAHSFRKIMAAGSVKAHYLLKYFYSYYQMTNPKKFLKGFLDPSLMTTKRKEETI